MFRRSGPDRRQGYSIGGHVRRILSAKGAPRVAASLGVTAVVAAMAFAHCAGSSITGPTTNQGNNGGNSGGGAVGHSSNLFPPAKFGPIRIPFTTLPDQNPCTGQPVAWDPSQSFTMMQGTTQTGTDGQAHFQYHMNTAAQGVTNIATSSYRSYTGNEQYDSQDMVFTDQAERQKFEWNVKIIAKGEDGTIFDTDDFFIHIVMSVPFDPTQADVTTYGSCK